MHEHGGDIGMATCEVCGNDYEMSFDVLTTGGGRHTFDSFECAIHKLAPICEHCGARVVGHGVQVEGRFYCSAHCARQMSALGAQARDAVTTG